MPDKLSCVPIAPAIGIRLAGYLGPVFNPIGTYMVYLPLAAAVISLVTDMSKRRSSRTTHYRWFVLEGAASWAAIEVIRLFIPFAGTWRFIASPLYRRTWLIQPVSVFGIIGLGVLVMVVSPHGEFLGVFGKDNPVVFDGAEAAWRLRARQLRMTRERAPNIDCR